LFYDKRLLLIVYTKSADWDRISEAINRILRMA
jgi:hypothetical protein